ncbi:hypothetical protein SESBI_32140 [Sesbania bispinosa]|nr:hypothetical protein SESBI_32140 [Sesbania bispinosa]
MIFLAVYGKEACYLLTFALLIKEVSTSWNLPLIQHLRFLHLIILQLLRKFPTRHIRWLWKKELRNLSIVLYEMNLEEEVVALEEENKRLRVKNMELAQKTDQILATQQQLQEGQKDFRAVVLSDLERHKLEIKALIEEASLGKRTS